jgi:hypothetical protein
MMLGLYMLINLAVLLVVARASNASRWRLLSALVLLGFVVGLGNNLIEAVAFRVMSPADALRAAGPALVVFVLLSLLAVTLAVRWRGSPPRIGGRFLSFQALIAIVVIYEALYFGAGALVYPYVADFYATRGLPPLALITALQVARALIFVGAAYPLLRSGLRSAPLVLGLAYSVLGGLAPLLLDNPYMPADIRFYHAIETGVSNFLFGLAVGFLARPSAPSAQE